MTSCRWRASPARTPCSRHAETPETSGSTTIGPREASRVGNRLGGSPVAPSKPPDPEGAPGQRASSAIRRADSRTTSHTGPWPAVDGDVAPNRRQARRKRRRQPRRRAPPQGVAKIRCSADWNSPRRCTPEPPGPDSVCVRLNTHEDVCQRHGMGGDNDRHSGRTLPVHHRDRDRRRFSHRPAPECAGGSFPFRDSSSCTPGAQDPASPA